MQPKLDIVIIIALFLKIFVDIRQNLKIAHTAGGLGSKRASKHLQGIKM